MKTPQNQPDLRFPSFNGEWKIKRLGDFFTFKNGVNADKSAYGKGRKFINVLDVIADRPITSENIIGSVEIPDKDFEKNAVTYGDILFQRSSETREEVGQSNVYLDGKNSATFGGFVIRGRPTVEISPIFFHNLLKTDAVRKDMTSRSGGSTRYNVGQESLSQVEVIVPDELDEQRKIATFLQTVDESINQLAAQRDLLKDYLRACMQGLFSQKIRFKSDQDKDFPNWEEKALNQVVDKTASSVTAQSLDSSPGTYPVFGASGIAGYVDFYNSDVAHIAVVKDGAGVGRLQYCEAKSSVLGTLESLTAKDGNSTLFVYYWMSRMSFDPYKTGSTIPHVYFKDYGRKVGAFPHPEEQRRIASFLAEVERSIEIVSEELRQSVLFKKSLLQQMFM